MKLLALRSTLFGAIDFLAACSILFFIVIAELVHFESLLGRPLFAILFTTKVKVQHLIIVLSAFSMMFGNLWLLCRYGMRIMAALEKSHPKLHRVIMRYHFWMAALIVVLFRILQAICDDLILATYT
jgi:hypothetical protein